MTIYPRWLRSIAFCAVLTCLYLYSVSLTFATLFQSSDGQVMYETARAIALENRLNIEGQTQQLPQVVKGHDGKYYSKYDLGLPLLAVPLIRWADSIAVENLAHRYVLAAIFVQFIPALSMALAVSGIYVLAETLYGRQSALWIGLVAGLGTTAWVYGAMFFAEAIIAAALTLGIVLLYYAQRRHTENKHTFLLVEVASLLFGWMIITRASSLIYVLIIYGWLWRYHRVSGLMFLRLSIFIVLGLGMLAWHNWVRFGDVLTTGYESETFQLPFVGIAGLLVSSGKSVFLYAPPLILSGVLFPRFRHHHPALAQLILWQSGAALLFYGAWWAWHGGWVWGPRFLVPLMPLWCLPLGELPKLWQWRWIATILFLIGFGIQVLGVFTNVTSHYAAAFADTPDHDDKTHYAMIHYDLTWSPLYGAWQQANQNVWEYRGLFRLQESGLKGNWSGGLPLGIGVIFGISIAILWQEWLKNYHEQT